MDTTAIRTMPEEYARMLTAVHSATAVIWSAYRIPSDPSSAWMVLVFLAVVARSLGPVGTTFWRLLFNTVLIASLLGISFLQRSHEGALALSVSVLFLLCIKLTTESAADNSQSAN